MFGDNDPTPISFYKRKERYEQIEFSQNPRHGMLQRI